MGRPYQRDSYIAHPAARDYVKARDAYRELATKHGWDASFASLSTARKVLVEAAGAVRTAIDDGDLYSTAEALEEIDLRAEARRARDGEPEDLITWIDKILPYLETLTDRETGQVYRG